MLVDTWCADRAPADSGGNPATLEMAEEFLPFGVGGDAVFVGGPHGSPSGRGTPGGTGWPRRVDGLWRRQILQLSECLSFSGMFCG